MAAGCRSSRPIRSGRVTGARLEPQPDDAVPRFDYERHVAALVDERIWPDFDAADQRAPPDDRITSSASLLSRTLGSGSIHLDIVDYPGEWLLDLPLLSKDYATWSRETLTAARTPAPAASLPPAGWLARQAAIDPTAPEDEALARELAAPLHRLSPIASRADGPGLSTLPPGRFLMPGDLEGFAGAHLLAARSWRTTPSPARLARRHDGPPLRSL